MSTPRKKATAKEIFNAAIEYYEPPQWEAYLGDACGDDRALLERVRALLEAHRQSDSFLDGNAQRTDDLVVSERLVPGLKKKSDLVVALAHLENKDLERFVREAAGIDLVVAGYNPSTVVNQPEDAATTILRPGMRGEFLGFARLGPPAADGKRTADLEAIMLKVADYPEDAALAAELGEIKAEIEADRRKAQLERELADSEGPILGQERYLGIPGLRIAGGTDEVLRNIIAERVLRLPPEVRMDKNVAYKDVPTGPPGK